jgi:hypothetical protein
MAGEVVKYTRPATIGTLSGSAVMNAFAFRLRPPAG